jgi:hypothetical protein
MNPFFDAKNLAFISKTLENWVKFTVEKQKKISFFFGSQKWQI